MCTHHLAHGQSQLLSNLLRLQLLVVVAVAGRQQLVRHFHQCLLQADGLQELAAAAAAGMLLEHI
jgi:hypothetical protein